MHCNSVFILKCICLLSAPVILVYFWLVHVLIFFILFKIILLFGASGCAQGLIKSLFQWVSDVKSLAIEPIHNKPPDFLVSISPLEHYSKQNEPGRVPPSAASFCWYALFLNGSREIAVLYKGWGIPSDLNGMCMVLVWILFIHVLTFYKCISFLLTLYLKDVSPFTSYCANLLHVFLLSCYYLSYRKQFCMYVYMCLCVFLLFWIVYDAQTDES